MPFGPWEIFILLVILVVIFGAGRLSQVGGAMGKSVREFRGAVREEPAPAAAPTVTLTAPPVACPECQVANPATNRFCSACGATMAAAPLPAVANVPAPAAGTAEAAPQSETAPAAPAASAAPDASAATAASGGALAEDAAAQHAPMSVPKNTCPSCATINPPGQPFCGQCGTGLKTAAA